MANVDPHTVKAFDDDLEQIRALVAEIGGRAEMALRDATEALLSNDDVTAAHVITGDAKIDAVSQAIERECIRLIALRAPMADDLRQVLAAFKIAVLIERMGDCARSIAEQVPKVHGFSRRPPLLILRTMSAAVADMVRAALDAFLADDAAAAEILSRSDDEVDMLHDELFRELLDVMTDQPSLITASTCLLLASKRLERIGDHATGIARVVHFSATGTHMPQPRSRYAAAAAAGAAL